MLILHRFQLLLEFFILINLLLIAAVDLGQILHHFLVILAHLPYLALEFLPFDVLLQGEGGAVSFDSLFFSLQVLQLQLPFALLSQAEPLSEHLLYRHDLAHLISDLVRHRTAAVAGGSGGRRSSSTGNAHSHCAASSAWPHATLVVKLHREVVVETYPFRDCH